MKKSMRLAACSLVLLFAAAPATAGLKVVTSIMPVHSIAAAVMGETGAPALLLSGKLSEHTASFTAAQISQLGKADVVFIIGQGLEAKLARIGGSEAVGGKSFVELSEAAGVKTFGIRDGGGWEAGVHNGGEAGDDDHAEGVLAFDPHVWLDPENAKAMADAIATELTKADPANASAYEANAKRFAAKIDAVSAAIAADLAAVKDTPFIVFHDAYQYFEKHFGLSAVGSITDISAASPSARRLKEIRDRLAGTKAVCVFREPQFDAKFVDTVIEGSSARPGVLDPLGAGLEPGPGAYVQLLRGLASGLKSCLAG
jgi:zinc transport system substrate-binding protein